MNSLYLREYLLKISEKSLTSVIHPQVWDELNNSKILRDDLHSLFYKKCMKSIYVGK